MGVIEASDRAWKGVQMTDERHGAAEWLRGIIGRYKDEADGFSRGCSAMVKMFGIDCKEETCRDCMIKMVTAIADRIDAERALPEDVEWPRFEDGGIVRIGDELEFEGKTMLVGDAIFYADGWALWCDREDMNGRLYGKYGERVKRPAPEVLDADGVPIEVGDTVYLRGNGREGKVVGFYEDEGETWVSVSYELGSDRMTVNTDCKALTHERPDSWEKLEEDARKTACNYAPAPRDEDGLTTCDGCRFQKSESCSNEMTIDLVERAKKLAGIEEEARND